MILRLWYLISSFRFKFIDVGSESKFKPELDEIRWTGISPFQ